jgi:hypothetical protein
MSDWLVTGKLHKTNNRCLTFLIEQTPENEALGEEMK